LTNQALRAGASARAAQPRIRRDREAPVDDITANIIRAWDAVAPRLQTDPMELEKRLARRRLKTLRRPLRSWCLTVRASDSRINPATAMISPEAAAYPGRSDLYWDHEVVIDARLLRKLCQPVHLHPGGEEWWSVAKKLGVSKGALGTAMRRGIFRVRHIQNYLGRIGKPVPLLTTVESIDTCCGRIGLGHDPVWGSAWQHLSDMIPDDFEQIVRRVPRWGVYDQKSKLRGWWWICPACKKNVSLLYYPLPPINLPEYFKIDPAKTEWDAIEHPAPTFACVRCHGVRYFSSMDKNSWGELIHHLSGGLLYGYEVKKPAWLKATRKRAFAPMINRAPSQRREEVLERLLRGWTDRQIARDMGISWHRTRNLVSVVLKQNRARDRRHLIEMLRRSVADPGGADVRSDSVVSAPPHGD
jgi:DNA-binding CsgD family transcriptional regulator